MAKADDDSTRDKDPECRVVPAFVVSNAHHDPHNEDTHAVLLKLRTDHIKCSATTCYIALLFSMLDATRILEDRGKRERDGLVRALSKLGNVGRPSAPESRPMEDGYGYDVESDGAWTCSACRAVIPPSLTHGDRCPMCGMNR